MEDIQATMDLMMNQSASIRTRSEGGLKELVLKCFVETQASHLLQNGNFPVWFHGFISRQEAEDHLRDKSLGSFLIRLSEKATGYILSYKGQDRCRHFVIKQTGTGQLVVSGDSVTHKKLPDLIEYFKITPIQPFGECLITEEESLAEDLYDVVHCKPSVKTGVSVQALRSLWDKRNDTSPKDPPVLPPKSTNRRLSSTSINRKIIDQATPPDLKSNLTLCNSLSGRQLSSSSEQIAQTDKSLSKQATEEGLHHRRRTRVWEGEGFISLDSQLECYSGNYDNFSLSDERYNSRSKSLPDLDEDYHHSVHSTNPIPPCLPSLPPKSTSVSSSSNLFKESDKCELADTNLTELQPNPLYQTRFDVTAGHNSNRATMFGISGKHNNVSLASENPYQDIPESENSNTYEDLPTVQHVNLDSPGIKPNKDVLNNPQTNLATEENNTYEVLLTIPQTNLSTQENNTYEDIPASQSNTYASVEELNTQGSQGKKIHKWWKFKPEGKKK